MDIIDCCIPKNARMYYTCIYIYIYSFYCNENNNIHNTNIEYITVTCTVTPHYLKYAKKRVITNYYFYYLNLMFFLPIIMKHRTPTVIKRYIYLIT